MARRLVGWWRVLDRRIRHEVPPLFFWQPPAAAINFPRPGLEALPEPRSTPRRNDIIVRISCVSYASYLEMDDIGLEERIELVPSSTSKTRREHGEESKEGRWAERKRSFEANLHSFPRWEGDEGLTMDEVQRFRTRGPVSRSFRVAEGAGAPPPRERRAFVFRFVSTREPRAGTASSEKRRPRASRCPSSAGFSSCRSSPFGASCSSSPRPCRRRLRRPRRTRGAPSSTESGGTGPVGTSAAPRRARSRVRVTRRSDA